MAEVWNFITNFDDWLRTLILTYQQWTYLILFIVLFCETGLVIMPLLPGDTLLFSMGTLAAGKCGIEIHYLVPVMIAGAILGDTTNYWIGRWIGPKVFHKDNAKYLNKEHLHRAHAFYERHGGKTVAIARFIPVIRAFAPFVAGVGSMNYMRFLFFSVVGSIAWVCTFTLAGFFFGRIPLVEAWAPQISLAIISIICCIIIVGIVKQVLRARRGSGE